MQYQLLYQHCVNALINSYNQGEAEQISKMLLQFYVPKKLLLSDIVVNSSTVEILKNKLQLLLQQQPIQYVLGEAWFYKYPFIVTPDVLIPRPETEELVENVLLLAKTFTHKNLTILDIGTGSGCIAITLKKEMPTSNIIAVDISDAALAITNKNAHKLGVAITTQTTDILNYNFHTTLPSQVDIIVSNPPYITTTEKNAMANNVLRYEPHLALFVTNDNALQFYEAILAYAKLLITKPIIAVEINENYGAEVQQLYATYYTNVTIISDMQSKQRIIIAQ